MNKVMHSFIHARTGTTPLAWFLVFFLLSVQVRAQSHQVSFSIEPTHIQTDNTPGLLNAAGFKFGYAYRFKKGSFLLAELGSTSTFGRDIPFDQTRKIPLEEAVEKALPREALAYRLIRAGGFLKAADFPGPKAFGAFYIHAGLSLRHANEVTHDFLDIDKFRFPEGASISPSPHRGNTSRVPTRTRNEVRWDLGASFGLSWQYRLGPLLNISVFAEADRYGNERSFITTGIKTFFNIPATDD